MLEKLEKILIRTGGIIIIIGATMAFGGIGKLALDSIRNDPYLFVSKQIDLYTVLPSGGGIMSAAGMAFLTTGYALKSRRYQLENRPTAPK